MSVSGPVAELPSPASSEKAVRQSRLEIWKEHIMAPVEGELAVIPLSAFCFMTGYIDAVTFSACYIWCAFQTGNTIQLALAIARLFSGPQPRNMSFQTPDAQALCSLLCFLFGAFVGRIGDRIGSRKRLWLVLGTLIQAGMTLGACLTAYYGGQGPLAVIRGEPSWTNACGFAALGFASASMGLQAHLGTRLGSQFATSVVLTTIWVQLMGDPNLFTPRTPIKTRDYKALAILMLFIGGIVGRALLDTIGSANTFAIGTGLRVLIAVSWYFTPAARKEQQSVRQG